jgi:predicted flavoprotein YhiN
VIGAGAAGLFCAGRQAGQRGLKVLLVDHSEKGRREDPHLGRRPLQLHQPRRDARAAETSWATTRTSAARRWRATRRRTSSRWCSATASPFHEKHKGQLFGDRSAEDFIRCCWPNASRRRDALAALQRQAEVAAQRTGGYTNRDRAAARCRRRSVVIATGGLSIPKIGATDFGYRIAASSACAW